VSETSVSSVEELVAAREARGLSPEDMIRQLKLAPRQLRALEEGDWQALPGLAFTRAVLRSYGRVVGVDVGPLIGSASPSLQAADLKPASTLDQPMPARSMLGFGSGGGGNRLAWLLLVVLGVVALALFFDNDGKLGNVRSWLSEMRTTDGGAGAPAGTGSGAVVSETLPLGATPGAGGQAVDSASDKPGTSAAAQGGAADQSRASGATKAAPGTATPADSGPKGAAGQQASGATPGDGPKAGAEGTDKPAAASQVGGGGPGTAGAATNIVAPGAKPPAATPDSAGTPAGASAEAKPAVGDGRSRVVKLVFGRDSWVEVRGADGSVLFTGTQKAQTDRQFTATGPVTMIIGNADAVKVEVDGQPFDLTPHTRAAIARVSLP
jgi:cytoskeleton protein RodZ